MITRRVTLCASCQKFPLRESMATGGTAECSIFNKQQDWDDGACVLHDRAKDMSHRVNLVRELMEIKKAKTEKEDGKK